MNNEPNKKNGAKPAVAHKKNILDDRRIRLALSVLGAIVAWMVVTIIVQPGTSNTIYNVPVDYTYDSAAYTSRGLSIVNAEEKTVNLKLSGDGYTIGSLSANDFVVYPDFSSVRDSGEKTLRLLVRGANGLLNGVTVTMEGNDNTVDVVFDVVEEKTLPVTITTNYLTIADGYILYSTDVSKENITLSGPSSELNKVATCTAEVTYSGELTESITLNTPLRFYTSGGKEVKFEYTELEENSVDVTLQVYKMATLPVDVNFINAPRDFDDSMLVYALSRKQLMVAGPSEILVMADEKANPKFIAADLMSQAEHDKLASAILVTTSESIADRTIEEINRQVQSLSRKEIIESSLENYGAILICNTKDEACDLANRFAPEHLEVLFENPMEYLGRLDNAGSIFLGQYASEPLGDYYAGPNHVLPTSGTARFFSPLSVNSFEKRSSFTYYTEDALREAKDDIVLIAEKEGLTAHANAIKVRF